MGRLRCGGFLAPRVGWALLGLAAQAWAAAPPAELAAEQLLPLADAHGGTLSLITPDRLQVKTGKVLLFKPARGEERLSLRLPVRQDGYYRVRTHLVVGPWRDGRYGLYRARADGVALHRHFHGWYGRGTSPAYRMRWHDWGGVFLRKPFVELSFHRDTKQAGDLLALEAVRLEPAAPAKLTEAERARRVPERPETRRRDGWAPCAIDAALSLEWVTAVPPRKAAVAVDGDLSEWGFSRPLIVVDAASIRGRGYGAPPPDGDADLSLAAQMAWQGATLYFAARVRDDELAETKAGKPWSSFWSHDGIVVLTHAMPRSGRRAGEGAAPEPQLTVGLNYHSPGCPPRKLPRGVRYVAKPCKHGYTLEAAVPFAALGLAAGAGERLRFMLIPVDIDPSAPAGERFQQYLWNTRGGGARRWGEVRLVGPDGWGGDLTLEREACAGGQAMRYIGVVDVFQRDLALRAIDIVDADSGTAVSRMPVELRLKAGRRYRLRGEVPPPHPLPRRCELRLSAK